MDSSFETYLGEIKRIPLLTPSQEISYSNRVQHLIRLRQVKAQLLIELGREPSLLEWSGRVNLSESELNQVIQSGETAKRKMVEANLRFVVSIAKRYSNHHLELGDLVQEGTIGLQKGVEKFDPSRGYRFSTHAYWWIREAILHTIAEQSRVIRLPSHVTEKRNRIQKAKNLLAQQLGRKPSLAEIAQQAKLSPSQVQEYLHVGQPVSSLNAYINGQESGELNDFIADPRSSPDQIITQLSLRHDVQRLLLSLDSLQRQVIILRFGLSGEQALSLRKTGDMLNISREQVRLVERKVLRLLQRRFPSVQSYLTH